jgi:branched-chain amino acid transport system substrate-binding protein
MQIGGECIMKLLRAIFPVYTLTFIILAFIASVSSAASKTPILIGIPTGLSGANSTVAPAVVQSSKLAVSQINENGGILGRPLKLVIADDESSAVGARKAFENLVYGKKVDVIISMETSAARKSGLPISKKGNVPYIYTSLYEGHACSPNLFVDGAVPPQMVNPVANYLMTKKSAKTFFLIGSDYNFGRGMLKAARTYVENHGGKVLGEEYQPLGVQNWTSIISQVRRAHPDAVIMAPAGGAPNVTVQHQYVAAGLTAPVGNVSVDPLTAQKMDMDAEGVLIAASYVISVDSKVNQEFLAAMKKKFGSSLRRPNYMSIPQYNAIYLYKAAVEKADTTDTEAVLKALPKVSFDGPGGKVKMNVQHHAKLNMRLSVLQYNKDTGRVTAKVLKTYKQLSPGAQCPDLK